MSDRPALRKRAPKPSEAEIKAEIDRAMRVEGLCLCLCRAAAIDNIKWNRKRAASKKD